MNGSLSTRPCWGGLPLTFAFACLVVATLGLVTACDDEGEETRGEAGITVITSTEVFADLIRPVGGQRAEVIALVPGGGDPHTYEPVPSQVVDISKADLVLVNGLGLEETLADVIENNVRGATAIIELSAGLSVLDAGGEGTGNPHFWLNVRHAMHYVKVARDALIEVDPAGAETYRGNARAYLAELEALDGEVEEAVDSIPAEQRKLVTFHDAFPYLADRYGLEVIGVVVRAPGREPSAGEVADLAREISEEDVPAVFREPQLSARVLEMAAEEAGVEVCTLHSGAFQDDVDTYVELMRHNAAELVRCLGDGPDSR